MKAFSFKKRENIMKIISLVIAILLWSYVMSEVDPVITRTFYNIPVKFINAGNLSDKKLVLLSSENETVDISVKGNRKSINEMTEKDISASVDLASAKIGSTASEIKVRLSDPSNVVESQNPSTLTIEIDKIIEKPMDLSIQTLGELPESHILDLVSSNEDKVTLKGPKGIIDSIYFAIAKVNINNRQESTLVSAPIKAYDKNKNLVKGIEVYPKNAEVELGISKTKGIPIEVVLQGSLPEGFLNERVEMSPANVLLSGPSGEIDKIEKILTAPVDPKKLFDLKTMSVSLTIPEGVKLVNSTENFLVRYNSQSKISKDISLSTDKVKNKEGKLIGEGYFKKPKEVIIKVKGEKGLVEALNSDDFSIKANIKDDIVKGKAKISIEAPEGIEVLSIEPSLLEIGKMEN